MSKPDSGFGLLVSIRPAVGGEGPKERALAWNATIIKNDPGSKISDYPLVKSSLFVICYAQAGHDEPQLLDCHWDVGIYSFFLLLLLLPAPSPSASFYSSFSPLASRLSAFPLYPFPLVFVPLPSFSHSHS